MPASKGGARKKYTADFKASIPDEIAAEGAPPASEIAAKHGLTGNIVYAWRMHASAIRKKAAKASKATVKGPKQSPEPSAASNGKGNGKGHDTPEAEPPGLRISGLTPLIRALVIEELTRQLPSIVGQEISKRFSSN